MTETRGPDQTQRRSGIQPRIRSSPIPEHRRCVPWSGLLLIAAMVGIIFPALAACAGEPTKHDPCSEQSRSKVDLEAIGTLRGHTRWVRSLAFTPQGDSLISTGDDGKVLLWKLNDANQINASPTLIRRYPSPVTAIAISPNGRRFAIGTWDGRLECCDTRDGRNVRRLDGHSETVTSLAFHPSGKYLASGSADDTLVLWDAATGEGLLSFHQGNEYDVTIAAFDPTGKFVVTGDGENQLKIWDAETGDEIRTLIGHRETVTSAAFARDGKTIISGGWDDTLQLWNAASGKRTKELRGHTDDVTTVLFVERDLIVSASEDKTVRIWNTKTGKTLRTMKTPGVAYALAYSTSRNLLAVGGQRDCRVFKITIDSKEKTNEQR